jgi:putative ABC transport system substrate-binding protein
MRALPRVAFPLLLWLIGAGPIAAAETHAVALVLSEPGGAYAEVARTLRDGLNGAARVTQRLASERTGASRPAASVAVAIGTEACDRLAASPGQAGPTLCVLLPMAAFDRIAAATAARGASVSAVLLDQPLARQMALIRCALPGRRRVAVLLGPESRASLRRLQAAALANGLSVAAGRVDTADDLAPVLESVLFDADVLLALPDSVVFNGRTIENILRTAFRAGVPMAAFSPAYVQAGALWAIYSTPEQVGRQAARAVRARLAGRKLPQRESPREFEIGVNPTIARSLGIDLPAPETLAARLREAGVAP